MSEKIFYVAKSGSDSFSGTKDKPFKSINRALQTAKTEKNAVIEIGEGVYRETIVLSPEHNGTVIRSSNNAVITGGISVKYADTSDVSTEIKERLTPDAAEHVRAVDLRSYGLSEIDWGELYPIGSYNTAWKYDGTSVGNNIEVFENDRRMMLARYPNAGYLQIDSVLDNGEAEEFPPQVYWDDRKNLHNPRGGTYIMDKETAVHISRWKSDDTAWLFGYLYHDWADSSTPVKIRHDTRAIFPKYVSRFGCKEGAQYYFYNVLEELDAPGEWYLDRESGILYVYPRSPDSVFEISVSKDPLISGSADNITIEGITLNCTRTTAIKLHGNRNRLVRLLIKNVGENAVELNGYDNIVEECEITHTGRGGIYLQGGDRDTLTHGNNCAVNNYIHDFSEVYQTYQPAIMLCGVGNRCAHNEITGTPHMAISYKGNEHLIEYNYLHEVVMHSKDAGAIYSGYDWAAHGTVIRYNLLCNIGGEELHPDGIYWDDGLSGQTAYGNILINVKKYGFLIGGGRDNTVSGNIIVGPSEFSFLYDDRNRDGILNGGWTHASCDTPDAPHWQNLKKIPYKNSVWSRKYPSLSKIKIDFSDPDDPDFPPNPANSVVDNNVIINPDENFIKIEDSVYKYSTVKDFHLFRTADEAGFDMERLKFFKKDFDFPDIPVELIGREK